jgi:hypothetical protein
MSPDPNATPQLAKGSARVALMALQVSLSDGPALGCRLENSNETLDIEGASIRLAEIPKPARCSAWLDRTITVIRCQTIHDQEMLRTHELTSQLGLDELILNVHKWCRGDGDPLVQVVGSGEEIVVPLSGVVAWLRDYKMRSAFGVDPNPKSRRGACAVLHLYRTGTFKAVIDTVSEGP